MILLKNLQYNKNLNLDMEVTCFVNDVLKEIIASFDDLVRDLKKEDWESENSNNVFNEIFPDSCVNKGETYILKKWDEFKQCVNSKTIRADRTDLEPLFYYVLYNLICWAINIEKEYEEVSVIKISEELKEKVIECEEYYTEDIEESENYVLNDIVELRAYLGFLFVDWDFLPETVDAFATLFIKCSEKPELLRSLDIPSDLSEYEPMMSTDLYKKYCEVYRMNQEPKKNYNDENSKIINNVHCENVNVNGDNNIIGQNKLSRCENTNGDKTEKKSISEYKWQIVGSVVTIILILVKFYFT